MLGAVLVVGYLMLVLIAAVGGPDSPAAKLPLLPDRPPAGNYGPGAEIPTIAPTTVTEPGATVSQPDRTVPATTTASAPSAAPPAPTITSSRPGRATKPSEPPGNGGGSRTTPPGNGG